MTLQALIDTVNASDKFQAKYGHLAAGGKLSANQKKFIKAAVRWGLGRALFAYSGRGMYGAKCPAVIVAHAVKLPTKASFVTDSMGLQVVCYAQF